MTKPEFINKMAEKNLFWSYDLKSGSELPDEVVIEQVLLYGDVPDLLALFRLWDEEQIRKVWEEQLVPQGRYRKINYYLGVFFFQVADINNYLNQRVRAYPRLERLQGLVASDPEGPYRVG